MSRMHQRRGGSSISLAALVVVGFAFVGAVFLLTLGRKTPPSEPQVPVGAQPVDRSSAVPLAREPADGPHREPESVTPQPRPIEEKARQPREPFLPYPNRGETDFKQKYTGIDADLLARIRDNLLEQENAEMIRLAEDRFRRGLAEEHSLEDLQKLDFKNPRMADGKRVLSVRQTRVVGNEAKAFITDLRDDEYPQLFAMDDEVHWVTLYQAQVARAK